PTCLVRERPTAHVGKPCVTGAVGPRTACTHAHTHRTSVRYAVHEKAEVGLRRESALPGSGTPADPSMTAHNGPSTCCTFQQKCRESGFVQQRCARRRW